MSEKACKHCEKVFYVKPSHFDKKVYCSMVCYRGTTQHKQTCPGCLKVFNARCHKGVMRIHCSRACMLVVKRKGQVIKSCSYCSKEIRVSASQVGATNFCNKTCQEAYQNVNFQGMKLNCRGCGKPFKSFNSPNFCSMQCRIKFNYREKSCLFCQKVFQIKPSHYDITFYCSRLCAAEDYKNRLVGENNPNYRNAGQKICIGCNTQFKSYTPNRLYCSPHCFQRNNMPQFMEKLTGLSRGKAGKRADLNGLFVRSRWEANYARYLNWLISQKQILKWEYEPETFEFKTIKKGNRFYTPDFKVTNLDGSVEYHEVKGWMNPESATKLRRMAKYYPEIKIIVIDQVLYKKLKGQIKRLIPNWE